MGTIRSRAHARLPPLGRHLRPITSGWPVSSPRRALSRKTRHEKSRAAPAHFRSAGAAVRIGWTGAAAHRPARAGQPQLPRLLRRQHDRPDRQLDADGQPVLARPPAHRFPRSSWASSPPFSPARSCSWPCSRACWPTASPSAEHPHRHPERAGHFGPPSWAPGVERSRPVWLRGGNGGHLGHHERVSTSRRGSRSSWSWWGGSTSPAPWA